MNAQDIAQDIAAAVDAVLLAVYELGGGRYPGALVDLGRLEARLGANPEGAVVLLRHAGHLVVRGEAVRLTEAGWAELTATWDTCCGCGALRRECLCGDVIARLRREIEEAGAGSDVAHDLEIELDLVERKARVGVAA